jgi:hypothetical protein
VLSETGEKIVSFALPFSRLGQAILDFAAFGGGVRGLTSPL